MCSSLMSPVYMEGSFRRTFLNVQLSLMLLCRLLNKAPAANNVGAESRRCRDGKNSLRSWCDRKTGTLEGFLFIVTRVCLVLATNAEVSIDRSVKLRSESSTETCLKTIFGRDTEEVMH